jgi:hypothetical protein
MCSLGRKARCKRADLIDVVHFVGHVKVAIETHAVRVKDKPRRAKAKRGERDRWLPVLSGKCEQQPARVEFEKVEPVNEDIGILQEFLGVIPTDSTLVSADFSRRIDIAEDLGHDIDLVSSEIRLHRPVLSIGVGEIVAIWIRDRESTDSESGECHCVDSAHTTDSANGDSLISQCFLLCFGEQP